jgi:TatD DNase family protein
MVPSLYDAHVHLAAPALRNDLREIFQTYQQIGLTKAIVVGTSPSDWQEVFSLGERNPQTIPAIGLHPWFVSTAPGDWRTAFESFLKRGVRTIGEIGLDQWVEGHDIEAQQEAFRWQFAIAAERNLPTSIHCLKAHEPLLATLRSVDIPARGFKLHAYNGPVATLKQLLDLGAHFSFNAGQLKPNAKRVRKLIRAVPEDRLLIETDAPDFLPTADFQEFQLRNPSICHPGNLRAGYQAVANLRGCLIDPFARSVSENFSRYFLR